jgi:hypothetical protein
MSLLKFGGIVDLRPWSLVLVRRKRILELGAGVGFLGSVVASLQLLERPSDGSSPGTLRMSDINDAVLSRCSDNVNLPCSELRYCGRYSDQPTAQTCLRAIPI